MPGFDTKLFVDLSEREAKSLNCSICLNIFDNAVNSECGHTFCKGCVQQWIEGDHKECPECRKKFRTVLSTYGMTSSDSLVVICSFVFIRNLRINSMVSELKTKCEFSNCEQLIEFGLLSGHLKECEHRLCDKCGFGIAKVDGHNCLEVMTKDRNKWKSMFNEIEQKNVKLQEELKTYRGGNEKTEKTINELKDKIKRLDQEIQDMSGLMIDSNKQMLIKSQLTDYILFGSCKCNIKIFQISTNFIELKIRKKITETTKYIDYNLKIPFTDMKELMYCSDPTLTAIIIKPNIEAYHIIQNVMLLGKTSANLDLNSQDLNDWFIIIVFKETIKLFFEHFIRQQIEPNIKCESISADTTKLFISRAQNKSMTA